MYINDIEISMNDLLLNKYNLYKAKYKKIMYHITSKKNAENILKYGFDINLSERCFWNRN